MTVKARAWDCPSCGLDKQRKIAEMVAHEGWSRMVTGTFSQPHVGPTRPTRHRDCDQASHVYRYKDGTDRWRLLSTCPHCCAFVSRTLALFRKRLRRRWGSAVQYLWAREDHKNGGTHVHIALRGTPETMTKKTETGKWLTRQWRAAGGGIIDLGYMSELGDGHRAGWYIGKYLAKRHDQKMATGYRRWSRTHDFARSVRMTPPPSVTGPDLEPPHRLGWLHPVDGRLLAVRSWEPWEHPPPSE